jgi:hypothetical protein
MVGNVGHLMISITLLSAFVACKTAVSLDVLRLLPCLSVVRLR